jgi:DNA-binding GntR family transcriptional regulator
VNRKPRADRLTEPEFSLDERIPYYFQLKNLLKQKVDQRVLRPGDRLPSEHEICEEFHVSRTVVRQALHELEYEGLIVKRKGIGTFIAEPKIEESFVQRASGFHADMTAQKLPTHSVILRNELVRADTRISQLLRLRAGAKVVVLERLRFVGRDPIQHVTSFIPHALCPEILETDFSRRSLYAFLEERGVFVAKGYRTVEAVRATSADAKLLKISTGSALVLIESLGCTENGTPVEYFRAVHRGDRTRFRVELVRRKVHRDVDGRPGNAGALQLGIEVVPASSTRRQLAAARRKR